MGRKYESSKKLVGDERVVLGDELPSDNSGKRICAVPECGTVLTSHNKKRICYAHQRRTPSSSHSSIETYWNPGGQMYFGDGDW